MTVLITTIRTAYSPASLSLAIWVSASVSVAVSVSVSVSVALAVAGRLCNLCIYVRVYHSIFCDFNFIYKSYHGTVTPD